MEILSTDIRFIKGIGEKKAKLFNKLGLFTVRDLITDFPRAYEDRTKMKAITELALDEDVCIEASIITAPKLSHVRKGLSVLKFRVADSTGTVDMTFFNQPWLQDKMKPGETYIFCGKVGGNLLRREMTNPVFEAPMSPARLTRRIIPIYRLCAGITRQAISDAVWKGLVMAEDHFPEPLPDAIRESHNLAIARFAYENIHTPASAEALEIARRRLIFEELFILTLGLRLMKSSARAEGLMVKTPNLLDFEEALPFSLTGAQRRAVQNVFHDMASGVPMNRLVQGDVGSGKTMVAAAAAWAAIKNGYQAALMVPTEILASQHYDSLSPLFEALGLRTGLLTGSMTPKKRNEVKKLIQSGYYHFVIGTHALITEDVEYQNLGLVVTDEQHRFGVRQRTALYAKGRAPHVLVMSATPIPRTLALILYGDLDISVIDELPPGRMPIETYAVDDSMRERIHVFIRRLVEEGRQVFIVCPLVDDAADPENPDSAPPDDGRKAVEAYTKHLADNVFPDLHIGFVHGKMKQKDKDAAMFDFSAGKLDILVSTTVIEVGINVPNAALMIVENAERFGLSQLHQLRGRVGRGKYKSYCVLFSESKNEVTRARLQIMTKTTDGFVISEEDLRLRGPGDFFGDRQHGIPKLKIADLATDADTLREAADTAIALLGEDATLSAPQNVQLRGAVFAMLDTLRSG